MTYAPNDLLAVQRYCREKTGQPWAALGIIHSTPQGGGYHEGQDLLVAARRAPGPQYPYGDYSYTDAPTRDLAPPHDTSLSSVRLAGDDAASAFDFGNEFPRFLEFNAWMRQRMLAGDHRTRDIREMIYTPDLRTVRRIDRTGKQSDSGDSSHLSHTHFSFFRDSIGRRDKSDNFLGLLREFFDGAKPASEGRPMALREDPDAVYLLWRAEAIAHTLDNFHGGPEKGQPVPLTATLKRIEAKAGALSDAQFAELKTAMLERVPTAAAVAAEVIAQLKPPTA